MIKNEEEWYTSENLQIPKIQFLDNHLILDLYENKFKGVFKVLDDTGKIQCQTASNFLQNIFANWENNPILGVPKLQNSGFIIRHFVGDVFYNVDNFLEKNSKMLTREIRDICQNLGLIIGSGSVNILNGKSTTSMLKTKTDDLIKKLSNTKCSFIRCIKPNGSQSSGIFNEDLVRSQLISSGSIAYQQLMRIGFPNFISIADLFIKVKSNLEFEDYANTNPKEFCNLLIRSCGLLWKDFKIGNTKIFFRCKKLDLLTEKLNDEPSKIKYQMDKLRLLRKKWKIAIIFTRFCVLGKSRSEKLIGLVQSEEVVDIPRKKIKLNKKSVQLTQTEVYLLANGIIEESCSLLKLRESSTQRERITISSNEAELTTENQLRKLLREERKKNEVVFAEYRQLQKRNVELQTELQSIKKQNDLLIGENNRFKNAFSYISREHDYVPQK
ncbi:myosin heavy chain 95F-like [Contarinia nasturtii]|uniref:myosin heavy chain 95F-like n=1 Tax=Contarinia nasturtii TaxID=265458 RepID=UPI0012D3DB15|nr:myosin heavy chain 95F-like [Contarinia nasturtii]